MLWNTDGKDWGNDESTAIAHRVVDGAIPGGIVLLHEILQTVHALPSIIEGLQKKKLL